MFKTDMQRAESSCTKDFTDVQMQNLALKCSQKFKGKKIIALVWKLTLCYAGFFEHLKGRGDFLTFLRKTVIKTIYFL